jgi:hypothetical protein
MEDMKWRVVAEEPPPVNVIVCIQDGGPIIPEESTVAFRNGDNWIIFQPLHDEEWDELVSERQIRATDLWRPLPHPDNWVPPNL